MHPILRSILAVLAGIVAFILLIVVNESVLVKLMYPAEIDWASPEEVQAHMMSLPTGAFLLVLFGWELGAFVGGAICAWLAGRRELLHAGIIGCAVFMATRANMQMLWHPSWMWAAGLMLPLPVSLLAGYWIQLRRHKSAGAVVLGGQKQKSSKRR